MNKMELNSKSEKNVVQWNLVSVNSRGPSEKVHCKRNFTIFSSYLYG